jgi:hypothetical protein
LQTSDIEGKDNTAAGRFPAITPRDCNDKLAVVWTIDRGNGVDTKQIANDNIAGFDDIWIICTSEFGACVAFDWHVIQVDCCRRDLTYLQTCRTDQYGYGWLILKPREILIDRLPILHVHRTRAGAHGPIRSKRSEQQRKQNKDLEKALRFHGHILLLPNSYETNACHVELNFR